jgi:8-oxo-dGTP pyrophosphatase MutT (NUDIX family)
VPSTLNLRAFDESRGIRSVDPGPLCGIGLEVDCVVTAAAGVAIFDTEHRLLLGKHVHDSRWATFGGAVEPGETTMDAARREVREEIDIEVRDLLLLGTFEGDDIYTVQYPGGAETYAVTMYVCWLDGITPRPDTEEISEVRWFHSEHLDSVDLAADMRDIVPAAFAFAWSEDA